MSVIEVAFFIFNAACGIFVAVHLASRYGTTGGLIGFPVGFCLGIAFWKGLAALFSLWHFWRPLRPRCRSGKCGQSDYTPIEVTPTGIVCKCGCGEKYLRTGRSFMVLRPDGTPEPYMSYDGPFGRWKSDNPGNGPA